MDKDFVSHRMVQLKMLTEVIEAALNEKVTMDTKRISIELARDNDFLLKVGEAIGLPDLDNAVKMCAGYNPDHLDRAHILMQGELRRIEEWPPNA